MKKIINQSEIKLYSNLWQDKKTVLVGGCFDIFHYGHYLFLKKAKAAGNYLIVALESDKFIKDKKKRLPIHGQKQRAEILSSFRQVDLIILLARLKTDKDYSLLVKEIKPSIIAVSESDPQLENKKRQSKEVGGQLKIVTTLVKNLTGSKIIKHASFFSD